MQLEHAVHIVVTFDGKQLVIEANRGVHSGPFSSIGIKYGRDVVECDVAHVLEPWAHVNQSEPLSQPFPPSFRSRSSVDDGCDSYSSVIRNVHLPNGLLNALAGRIHA